VRPGVQFLDSVRDMRQTVAVGVIKSVIKKEETKKGDKGAKKK